MEKSVEEKITEILCEHLTDETVQVLTPKLLEASRRTHQEHALRAVIRMASEIEAQTNAGIRGSELITKIHELGHTATQALLIEHICPHCGRKFEGDEINMTHVCSGGDPGELYECGDCEHQFNKGDYENCPMCMSEEIYPVDNGQEDTNDDASS